MSRLIGKWVGAVFQQEVPSGTVNGSNTAFTLSATPHSAAAVVITVNGLVQRQTTHYSVSGATVTFTSAPTTGQEIYAIYVKRD